MNDCIASLSQAKLLYTNPSQFLPTRGFFCHVLIWCRPPFDLLVCLDQSFSN